MFLYQAKKIPRKFCCNVLVVQLLRVLFLFFWLKLCEQKTMKRFSVRIIKCPELFYYYVFVVPRTLFQILILAKTSYKCSTRCIPTCNYSICFLSSLLNILTWRQTNARKRLFLILNSFYLSLIILFWQVMLNQVYLAFKVKVPIDACRRMWQDKKSFI